MSEIVYDTDKLRSQGIPAASFQDWMYCITCNDFTGTYWLTRSFIDIWGTDVF